jgi:hypothetical protein
LLPRNLKGEVFEKKSIPPFFSFYKVFEVQNGAEKVSGFEFTMVAAISSLFVNLFHLLP